MFSRNLAARLVVGETVALGSRQADGTGMRADARAATSAKLYKEVDLNPIVTVRGDTFKLSALSSDDADEHR